MGYPFLGDPDDRGETLGRTGVANVPSYPPNYLDACRKLPGSFGENTHQAYARRFLGRSLSWDPLAAIFDVRTLDTHWRHPGIYSTIEPQLWDTCWLLGSQWE